jgi:hypothetical protein
MAGWQLWYSIGVFEKNSHWGARSMQANGPISATAATSRGDCNSSVMPPLDAAPWLGHGIMVCNQ